MQVFLSSFVLGLIKLLVELSKSSFFLMNLCKQNTVDVASKQINKNTVDLDVSLLCLLLLSPLWF